jgi:hypothetical protein
MSGFTDEDRGEIAKTSAEILTMSLIKGTLDTICQELEGQELEGQAHPLIVTTKSIVIAARNSLETLRYLLAFINESDREAYKRGIRSGFKQIERMYTDPSNN